MAVKRITPQKSIRTDIVDVEPSPEVNDIVSKVVGMSLEEATKLAGSILASVRVTREDDKWFIGTCEFRTDRLNVEIEKGLVVKAGLG